MGPQKHVCAHTAQVITALTLLHALLAAQHNGHRICCSGCLYISTPPTRHMSCQQKPDTCRTVMRSTTCLTAQHRHAKPHVIINSQHQAPPPQMESTIQTPLPQTYSTTRHHPKPVTAPYIRHHPKQQYNTPTPNRQHNTPPKCTGGGRGAHSGTPTYRLCSGCSDAACSCTACTNTSKD